MKSWKFAIALSLLLLAALACSKAETATPSTTQPKPTISKLEGDSVKEFCYGDNKCTELTVVTSRNSGSDTERWVDYDGDGYFERYDLFSQGIAKATIMIHPRLDRTDSMSSKTVPDLDSSTVIIHFAEFTEAESIAQSTYHNLGTSTIDRSKNEVESSTVDRVVNLFKELQNQERLRQTQKGIQAELAVLRGQDCRDFLVEAFSQLTRYDRYQLWNLLKKGEGILAAQAAFEHKVFIGPQEIDYQSAFKIMPKWERELKTSYRNSLIKKGFVINEQSNH